MPNCTPSLIASQSRDPRRRTATPVVSLIRARPNMGTTWTPNCPIYFLPIPMCRVDERLGAGGRRVCVDQGCGIRRGSRAGGGIRDAGPSRDQCGVPGFCGGNRVSGAIALEGRRDPGGKEDHPVIYVNRYDVRRYLQWLTEQDGRAYRLPTGIEFRHAAYGGLDRPRYPRKNSIFVSSAMRPD